MAKRVGFQDKAYQSQLIGTVGLTLENCFHAQFDLGLMFDNGNGVPKDFEQAVNWYRKAAEQDHVAAQYNLAVAYEVGDGVPKAC